MSTSVIRFDRPQVGPEGVRWAGEIEAADGRRSVVRIDVTTPDPASFVASARPWLLAFLVPAMAVGAPVTVEGAVDEVTLANLMEWQEAMVCWRPHLTVVPLHAGSLEVRRSPGPLDAVTAFSGGVDSCFTAVRHASPPSPAANRTVPLRAGLMVHGFDIALADDAVFDAAFARSERILTALGLQALRARTDLRSLETAFGCDWETEAHGIWLAAVLACVEGGFGSTLIPSTYPYDQQRLPWASNPLTDHLLGSGTRRLRHDGAAHDKLAKVAAIADHPAVARDLRVCWQGEQLDRNCGACFKCVVTQVCFWLSGVTQPRAFDTPCEVADVAALALADPYKVHLGRRLHAAAEAQGEAGLATALATALEGAA